MNNFSSFKIFFMLLFIGAAVFVSCNKESITDIDQTLDIETPVLTQAEEPEVTLEMMPKVNLVNGTVQFVGGTAFFDQAEIIARATPEVLDAWEQQVGFKSLRTAVNEAYTAFDAVETEAETEAFLQQYGKFVKIVNGDAEPVLDNFFLASFVNEDATYLVDEAIIKAVGSKLIEVRDGDFAKLEIALATMQTNERESIYVVDANDFAETRTCSDANTAHYPADCSGGRRVNLIISNGASSCGCGYYRGYVHVRVHGEKKSFGNCKSYKTSLDFNSVGYEIVNSQGTWTADNLSGGTTSDAKNLYATFFFGNQGSYSQVKGTFNKVKGRATSRGVGANFAVVCCGYLSSQCPSAN